MSFPRLCVLSVIVMLACCEVPPARRDADEPIFGRRATTTFQIETDRAVDVHELVHIARVIGVYKELTPVEMETVRLRLLREVNGLVQVELQSLRPVFERAKAAVEKEHRAEMKAAKDDPTKRAALEAEHQANLERMERELHQRARAHVLARLGKDLALPLSTSDQRSVVAFGRMSDENMQVTSKAYEIDVAVSKLAPGAVVEAPDGRSATLTGGTTAQVKLRSVQARK